MAGIAAEPQPLLPTAPEDAALVLRRDGAVVIEGVWPRQGVERWRDIVFATHPEFLSGEAVNAKSQTGTGRFYAPIVIGEELLALFDAPELCGLLEDALGADYVFEAFGILMAEPGAEPQNRHRDGGVLFPGTGLDRVLPPVALTVAVPLVDVSAANSRTAVIPGSHRQVDAPPAGDPFAPDLPLGSLFAWDYRTLHFGTEHLGSELRPLLYFVPCRPYWLDHRNFGRNSRSRLIVRESVAAREDRRFARAERVPG